MQVLHEGGIACTVSGLIWHPEPQGVHYHTLSKTGFLWTEAGINSIPYQGIGHETNSLLSHLSTPLLERIHLVIYQKDDCLVNLKLASLSMTVQHLLPMSRSTDLLFNKFVKCMTLCQVYSNFESRDVGYDLFINNFFDM